MAEKRSICLINDSFPPVIDGVANAVTNYASVIQRDYGDVNASGCFILLIISHSG